MCRATSCIDHVHKPVARQRRREPLRLNTSLFHVWQSHRWRWADLSDGRLFFIFNFSSFFIFHRDADRRAWGRILMESNRPTPEGERWESERVRGEKWRNLKSLVTKKSRADIRPLLMFLSSSPKALYKTGCLHTASVTFIRTVMIGLIQVKLII